MKFTKSAYALGEWLGRLLTPAAARRRAILSAPFAPTPVWQTFLHDQSSHYRRLPDPLRDEFRHQLQVFLAEKKITGVDVEVSEELRLLVAASAVTLSCGWPGYVWDELAEVLVYPQAFNREYGFDNPGRAGEMHPWGIVIVSAPSLLQSFAIQDQDDGYHLGIHEFAHLLDLKHAKCDGVPRGLPDQLFRQWLALLDREEARLERGESVLSPYGLKNHTELFAVAVEAFFQMPVTLAHRQSELYAFLASYFGQDPAAWSSSTDVPEKSAPASEGSVSELIDVTLAPDEAEPDTAARRLRDALTRLSADAHAEIWVDLGPFPALCALVNGGAAVLMCLRYAGDPGFTSRNPGYHGPADATISYRLSNGQVDECPAAWTYSRQQVFQALEEFVRTRRVPESIRWFNESEDGTTTPNDGYWNGRERDDR